jgi:flagellin
VGAGNELNDRIAITIGSAKSSSLGVGGGSSYSTGVTGAAVGSTALVAGGLSVNGYIVGAANADGVSSSGDTTSGIAIAAAINAVNGQSGVTATVQKTTLAGTAVTGHGTAIGDGIVKINGVNIGAIAVAGDAAARGAQMTAAINAKSGQTGVVASFSTANGAVALTAADGRNISVSIGGAGTAITKAMTGLEHAAGGTTVGTATETITRSSVKLSSSSSTGITIAGVTAEALSAAGLTAGYSAAVATAGAGVSTVDLSTAAGSQTALSTLDKAINTITDMRASMGAYQNRLTASIANLEISSMNLQGSRSRILDSDYAKETTNLAKAQIIQQAATAMLAQANQSSQSVLALLK